MKYCKSCELKYESEQSKCVFCNGELENIDDAPMKSSFPKFKGFYPWQGILLRYIVFGFIALFAVSVLLKMYIFKELPLPLMVLSCAAYCLLMVATITSPRRQITAKTLFSSLLTSGYIIVIVVILKLPIEMIFFEYIFPSIMIVCLILQVIFLYVLKRKTMYDNLLYSLLAIVFGMLPMICMKFEVVEHTYLGSIAMTISLLFLVWLIIFEGKHVIGELKRRFHI